MPKEKAPFVLPTSPEDIKKINQAIREASNSLIREESEKEFRKGVRDKLKEELNLPPKLFNKMLKVYHKQNFPEERNAAEEFEVMYEKVFPNKSLD